MKYKASFIIPYYWTGSEYLYLIGYQKLISEKNVIKIKYKS